ncbi:MAG: alpha/beta hydrolase [Planctomycetota bacterium]
MTTTATKRRRLPWYARWALILMSLYVIYCGLMFFFQDKFVYRAGFAGQASDRLPTEMTERIELATDEGHTVAWFVPAPDLGSGVEIGGAHPARPLAVFFHGNSELIDHQQRIIDLYHGLGVSVLMVEYRGYGHSDGTPSEKHILADTLAVLEGALEREDVDADRLVLHGRSLGGGFATAIALDTEPAALVVESTFKSLASMATRYGVPPLLITSRLRSEETFQVLDLPILILHGRADKVVPVAHAHALDTAGKDTTLVLFEANHNTLPPPGSVGRYEQAVRLHLEEAGVIEKKLSP